MFFSNRLFSFSYLRFCRFARVRHSRFRGFFRFSYFASWRPCCAVLSLSYIQSMKYHTYNHETGTNRTQQRSAALVCVRCCCAISFEHTFQVHIEIRSKYVQHACGVRVVFLEYIELLAFASCSCAPKHLDLFRLFYVMFRSSIPFERAYGWNRLLREAPCTISGIYGAHKTPCIYLFLLTIL